MNYEIVLALKKYICKKTSCPRFREGMYLLHDLIFRYNYAWIEIDESVRQRKRFTAAGRQAA